MKAFKRLKKNLVKESLIGLSKACKKSTNITIGDTRFIIPLIHGMGSNNIFILQEPSLTTCLQYCLKHRRGTVLDVGVHVGWILLLLKSMSNSVPYIGFEPSHSSFHYVSELIRLNSFNNADIFPIALSNKNGISRFYYSGLADPGAALFWKDMSKAKYCYSMNVLTNTGDNVLKEVTYDNISFVKIDVEGAEYEVLSGLKETIKKYSPIIFCEIWPLPGRNNDRYSIREESIRNIMNLMAELKYEVIGLDSNGLASKVSSVNEFSGELNGNYILCSKTEFGPFMKFTGLKES